MFTDDGRSEAQQLSLPSDKAINEYIVDIGKIRMVDTTLDSKGDAMLDSKGDTILYSREDTIPDSKGDILPEHESSSLIRSTQTHLESVR